MEQITKVVVIGCSGCGALAARTVKKLKPSLNVTIIREQEEKGLLTRCATPYICCGNVTVMHPTKMIKSLPISKSNWLMSKLLG